MAEQAGSAGAVHLACCFDRKMELPFLVLAGSLKRHLKDDRKVVLHAFHSDPIALDLAYFAGFMSIDPNHWGGGRPHRQTRCRQ